MEIVDDVYRAARDGKFQQLQDIIEPLMAKPNGKSEVNKIVSEKTNGTTPLIMACRNGHLSVSEYLIEKCSAAIEQVGSVTFDGETIDGAPPLWCAAAAGRLDIVRLLVRGGAGVNETTSTNSTPLRAACFDGHTDIVWYLMQHGADAEIANRHGHTCLMIACYKGHLRIVRFLLKHSVNINRKSLKGNTALHDCAESGSLAVMKLLLTCGAHMEEDAFGMTPLMAAAATGHTPVVEYLINRPGPLGATPAASVIQRIDALELLGATYVDKKHDAAGALLLWLQAMGEREAGGLEKPAGAAPVGAYGGVAEARSRAALQALAGHADATHIEALLVRERILGPAHPDTSYYMRYRGAVCADAGDFTRCVALWLHALDIQQSVLAPLNQMTLSSFLSFAELFAFLLVDGGDGQQSLSAGGGARTTHADMMTVLERGIAELSGGVEAAPVDAAAVGRLLVILLHLLSLLSSLSDRLAAERESRLLREAAYRLVRLDARDAAARAALHLACSGETAVVGRYPVCAFPSPLLTGLLLDVGAAPDARDAAGNTPLHVAVTATPADCRVKLVRLLLAGGAHLDAANAAGHRPADLLAGGAAIHDIVSPLDHLTLQCFAARAVVRYGIPVTGNVPRKLEPFIALH